MSAAICYFALFTTNSALLFRVLNSTAISAVTGVLDKNEITGFHFVIVNIDGTDVVGSVLFQYVVPRLTSVPENRVIEAYVRVDGYYYMYICLLNMYYIGFSSHLSPMCSGGVTVAIIGGDVDAAVEPILTLFNRSNLTRSGVRHSRIALFKQSIIIRMYSM